MKRRVRPVQKRKSSDIYHTDMSQTDSRAVTVKEHEYIVAVVNQLTVYKVNNTVVVTL